MSTVVVLLSAFVLSIIALAVFIWTQRVGMFEKSAKAAEVIFAPGEIGTPEDPAAHAEQTLHHAELVLRARADASSAPLVFFFLCCAFAWLLVASGAGLVASIKLHEPDWLTSQAWLTFGRIRTIHLNAVAYGWAPMAGLGIALFAIPRLLKTELVGAPYAFLGAALWNAALIAGLGAIAVGLSDGMEWLEIPWQVDGLFVIAGALVGVPLVLTLLNRKVDHLYVSVWYMGCALFWFPVLFLVGNAPDLHKGVEQAATNWWYGHNALGLFYTPLALGSVYYFLPKVIGRPVQSYNLSLLGFWGLAFFYGQVGGHHLVGGPVPGWLITLSIVQSMMMIIPVLAFAVNQYQTLKGRTAMLWSSPTLRFIGFGGLMYVVSSIEGSLEALRSVNQVTHFTHFTVGHAHLGLYGFVSMVFFGAIYFVVPRVSGREWPSKGLIAAHFWLAAAGITIYFVSLSVGGWLQGKAMLDESRPFIDSVTLTGPYLKARTLGGSLMALGHVFFILNFAKLLLGRSAGRSEPTLLKTI
ncbi:cbb3-type cytochrome c oxidase subunit I [Roseateles cellulosilyticus]|uniref:Cbb3-type cytochrome c oxidase subunit I n=1 Tax=Pelomonas cellulosilytica TaxID=2906762 RepID=A0ABS8XW06_9BURK|nr:cbb3-type cytochrome c oxidase subunit I [Pelomonas sp. P8]MCE4556839.1 cbb3-type cytochrome c oxidase subunit I [Pelomonas sp. P8]